MLKQKSEEYRGFRNAGIRLSEELHPRLAALYKGRTKPMLRAVHAFDQAHTIMLVEQGHLDIKTAGIILKALRELETEGVEETRLRVGGGLHSGENYIIRKYGEDVGGRYHVGRSSGDLSSVAINWIERERLIDGMKGINRLRGVLLDVAARSTDIIMPGYSFGQHAQPMTVAHLYLSWVATLERDFQRHHQAFGRINTSPAGSVIMVGTDFYLDRQRTADLLGFDAIHENSADAILELTPDDILELAAVFAQVYHSMARFAEDIIQWSTVEYNFVTVPDRFSNTSSIMMHKKNVVGPAEVKGAAAEALGAFVTTFSALRGTTGLTVTERYYGIEMLHRVAENLILHLDWFCTLLPELQFNKEYLLEHSWMHWATTTDLGSALVRERDLPWRSAHQIVGIAIRLCEERGLTPAGLDAAILDEAAMAYHGQPAGLTTEQIRHALDPKRFVESRTLQGGTASSESLRQVEVLTANVNRDIEIVSGIEGRLAAAERRLRQAVDEMIAASEVAS